jgi:hypothetical protein
MKEIDKSKTFLLRRLDATANLAEEDDDHASLVPVVSWEDCENVWGPEGQSG